jgi:hypothetical protein
MALFPMGGVLRGFSPSTYYQYASGKNPCAALPIEKIAHLRIENSFICIDITLGWIPLKYRTITLIKINAVLPPPSTPSSPRRRLYPLSEL